MTIFLRGRLNRVFPGVTHAHGRWKGCEKRKKKERASIKFPDI